VKLTRKLIPASLDPTHPLTLSLSKGCPFPFREDEEGRGFDKLSLSGFMEQGA
jgi:hypothetical protein